MISPLPKSFGRGDFLCYAVALIGVCPNKGRYRVFAATQPQNAYSMPSESDTGLRRRCAVCAIHLHCMAVVRRRLSR